MPTYKLLYFPARAAGEVIRQIFAYAGQEYEDVRIDYKDWDAIKESMPFHQMPVLEIDGKQLPQSAAIARYLAKKFNLAGKDEFEVAWVDAIVDQFKDYLFVYSKFYYAYLGYLEGDKEETRKEFGEPARDNFYPLIVNILKKNPSGFLVGDSVTFVDFLISEHVATMDETFPGFLAAYPEVLKHAEKIRAIPQIKAWIEKRPISDC